ncbi:MAG TPA: sigma-70 family RNA polymerase sigma factor [Planctomycetes bacterium]|nr:sigma-70 family RNA polymerase sigma factor [Planctomycetota bacterium]
MDHMRKTVLDASRGDPKSIDTLLQQNLADLHLFVQAKMGPKLLSRESTSDLVQSVCREVLQEMKDFEFRGLPAFRAWLFRKALHKIVDKARYHGAEKRDPNKEQSLVPQENGDASRMESLSSREGGLMDSLSPSRIAMEREHLEKLEACLHALPEDYREAILQTKLIGRSYKELAQEWNRSEGAVRNLVYRGLARLALLLEEEGLPPLT